MGEVLNLRNDEFFRHVVDAVGAKTYLELFAGTGARTVRPIADRCQLTLAESNPERRDELEKLYPDAEIYDLAEAVPQEKRWDVVSADPYISMDGSLALLRVIGWAPYMAKKAVITYAPVDVAAYVKRCGGKEEKIEELLKDCQETFGATSVSPQRLADRLEGELIATRKGSNPDLVYCGVLL